VVIREVQRLLVRADHPDQAHELVERDRVPVELRLLRLGEDELSPEDALTDYKLRS